MARLGKYMKRYVWQMLVVFGLVFVSAMADLQLPDYMSKIVNEGITGQNLDLIFETGLMMLGVALLSMACTICVSYLASQIAAGFARDLRLAIFSKVEGFSLAEYDRFSTASLITRSTNDIQQIQMVLVMLLRMVLSAPIMGVGAILKALGKSSGMSWITIISVGAISALMVFLFVFVMPKFKSLQKLVDRLNLVTRENLTGLRVIRAFNTEAHEEKRFDGVNKDLTKINLFINRMMSLLFPAMMLIMNITCLGIIWVGSQLVDTGGIMIGDMMAFMQYTIQVIMSFLIVSFIFIFIPRAAVSAGRIADVLEAPAILLDPDSPVTEFPKKGLVEFKNVTFKYGGADLPVLSDISFTANPGETTAIIGSTGSGKSTLVNLIPRLYDASSGQVLVDGVDVRETSQSILHDLIGYVPQMGVLFSGTVASNIKYGYEHATDEQMIRAAKIAQAYDFIDNLDEKFNTPIAQGGTNVSGGQKQRLSIARAILKNPEIYIFDDSFSALDFKTDARLRETLAKEITATVIIVAQRISTILNADKIIVLDSGKIVGIGRHHELLKSCGVYYEIASSQLSEEELV
ncbi:MAG TPA: multidrug ABC transporter ATP-binding protein [Ruminococcaceae bacterium]|nr:multidrug ABC transporter ATP-binding protein [Oscillospiraceae bacterium]